MAAAGADDTDGLRRGAGLAHEGMSAPPRMRNVRLLALAATAVWSCREGVVPATKPAQPLRTLNAAPSSEECARAEVTCEKTIGLDCKGVQLGRCKERCTLDAGDVECRECLNETGLQCADMHAVCELLPRCEASSETVARPVPLAA